jgi:hypothetical protein
MAARTAPDGYASNFRAILDLLRFGPAIWGPIRTTVLLFHVERSTGYGWQSDQHAESQAMTGVRSQNNREWIRAPAGVGHGTYHRENAELLKAGVLRKFPRRNRRGGHAPTEFAPDWLAIRAAIEAWKTTTTLPAPAPLFDAPGPTPFSQAGTRGGPTVGEPFSQAGTRGGPTVGDTVVKCEAALTVVSESRTREIPTVGEPPPTRSQTSATELRETIEAAYGKPLQPSDPIPGQVLAIGDRLSIPTEALCRWVCEFATAKRAAGYPITSPRLFVAAAGTDLILWAKQNGQYVYDCGQREARAAERRAIPISTMPDAPRSEICPTCKEEKLENEQCHSEQCVDERTAQQHKTRTKAI